MSSRSNPPGEYRKQPVEHVGQTWPGKLVQGILNEMDQELRRLRSSVSAAEGAAEDTASYVTINAEPSLTSERRLAVTGAGISMTDAGANSTVTIDLDADLDAIASLGDSGSTTGFPARTAANTWALRTLTAPAAGFTITNPAGVAGDPTFVLANDLAALEGLATLGIPVRTATDTWAITTMAQGDVFYATSATGLAALTKDANATRYLSNTGASNNPAWAQVSLTSGVSGTLPVGSGGTGLTAGTSGGILGFTGTTTLASSVLLTANALILGGGAGATPTPMASLGTTTTVLHGNAAGAPTFGAVSLTADVTGDLPFANLAQGTARSVLGVAGNATADFASIQGVTAHHFLKVNSGGTGIGFEALSAAMLPSHNHSDGSTGGSTLSPTDITVSTTSLFRGSVTLEDIGIVFSNTFNAFTINLSPLTPSISRDIFLPNALGTLTTWNSLTGMPLAGTVLYGAGSTTPLSALAIGTAGQILTVNAGATAPQWSTNASIVDIARTWATLQKFPDNTFQIIGSATAGKIAQFEVDGWAGAVTRTFTLPDASVTVAGIDLAQTWTAAQTFRVASAIRSEAAATQDAIVIAGRAGGTSSFAATLTPATLAASRTVTIPDGGGNYTLAGLQIAQSFSATQTFTVAPKIDIASAADGLFWECTDADGNGVWGNIDSERYYTSLQHYYDNSIEIHNATDATKTLRFSLAAATANADLTLSSALTADRTVTIPDGGGDYTLAGLQIAQTYTKLQTIASDAGCLSLTPLASSIAIVVNVDTTASGVALSVVDANTGFTTTLAPSTIAAAPVICSLPNGSGTIPTTSSTDTFNNKTMGVTTILRTDSVTSGSHWRDVNTSTKRVYPILTGSVGSNSLTFNSTFARDWEFKNCAGTVVIVGNEAAAPSTDNLGSVDRTGITGVTGPTNLTSATAVVGTYLVAYEMHTTTATGGDGTITFDVVATGDGGAATVASAALSLAATGVVRGEVVRYVASGALQYQVTQATGVYTAATTRTALRVRVMYLG